jgi:hypothetical protein
VGENAQPEPPKSISIVEPGAQVHGPPEPDPEPESDPGLYGPPEPKAERPSMPEPRVVSPLAEVADPSPTPPPGAARIPAPDVPVNWTPKAKDRRRIFVSDVRGNGNYLRTTWHADGNMFVFSVWNGDVCLGAVRVPVEDAADMVSLLMDGMIDVVAAGPLPLPPAEGAAGAVARRRRRRRPQQPPVPTPWDELKTQLTAWARLGAKKAATLKHLRLTTAPRSARPAAPGKSTPQRPGAGPRLYPGTRATGPHPPAPRMTAARPRPSGPGHSGPQHSGPIPPVSPARRRSA